MELVEEWVTNFVKYCILSYEIEQVAKHDLQFIKAVVACNFQNWTWRMKNVWYYSYYYHDLIREHYLQVSHSSLKSQLSTRNKKASIK